MIAGLALGSDNKRYFRGKLPRLAIITIIFMPLLYCAMYLWAFWNPFGEVDKIPAAIVNLDTGAVNEGQPLQAGNQVVSSLIASGQLGLTETTAEDAANGLASGEYYYTITIPPNFSQAVVSPNTDVPEKAQISFTFNDANNYLSTIIGEDAAQQVNAQVNSTIGATGVEQVLVSIQESGTGIQQAADGASELAAGINELNTSVNGQLLPGAQELSAGIGQAASGAGQLAGATGEIASGANADVPKVISQLTGPQIQEFNRIIGVVNNDAKQLNIVITNIENSLFFEVVEEAIAEMRASGDPVLINIANRLDEQYQAFQTQLNTMRSQYNGVMAKFAELERLLNVPPGGSLTQQLNEVDAAAAVALREVLVGVNELNSGAQQLNSGLAELNAGGDTLVGGINELSSGTAQLLAGANELSSGLEAGLAQIPTWTPEQRQATASTLSTPVNLNQDIRNVAATFGTGFAPFFSTLALFVGALLTWMLLTPMQPRPITAGVPALRAATASYVPAILVGMLQATVLFSVIKWVLQMPVAHPVGIWAFMVLMSWTFLAMIQMFNAIFDVAIGRVVSLALLMVMLISSGGIYPVPTTATAFQIIHPFDPMTYTVMGLRQLSVAVVTDSRLWLSVGVLVGISVVCLAVTSLMVVRNRRYTMERLYPSIEV